MILVDANLLVYAHVRSVPQHDAARTWLDEQLNSSHQVALPWPSILAFVRLVSNPRVFANPEPVGRAWNQALAWLALSNVWIPQPTDRHAEALSVLLNDQQFKANLVPDAHLAALAMEHGLTLCSADTDFGRWKILRWLNPISR
jgi:toxin-antitoxin system PIN domain toxin